MKMKLSIIAFKLLPLMVSFLLASSCQNSQEIELLETENEQNNAENELLNSENEQLKAEIEQLQIVKEQLETENEQLETENEQLKVRDGQRPIGWPVEEDKRLYFLPLELRELYGASGIPETHEISTRRIPDYLIGDYDGDSRRDYLIAVVPKQDGGSTENATRTDTFGTEVVLRGNGEVNWLDEDIGENRPGPLWFPAYPGEQVNAFLEPAPELNTDGFHLVRMESSSALVYWDGSQFALHWTGD